MSFEADDYIPKQSARDAEYRRQYAVWLAGLTPEKLARVKAAGLGQPVPDESGHGANFRERDLAETPLASEESHPLDRIEPTCDQPGYQAQRTDAEEIWDILRRLVGDLLTHSNSQLSLECLALVSGVSFLGDSMSAIAKRYGVTRAAVSKRCVELSENLGLPPSRSMRALTARDAYARARCHRLQRHD